MDVVIRGSYQIQDTLEPLFEPICNKIYYVESEFSEFTGLTPSQSNIFFAMNIGFLLSVGVNFLKDPETRKWYSTICGLVLGFYMHGLPYWRTIIAVTVPYLLMVLFGDDRRSARFYSIAFTTFMMGFSNFVPFWDTKLIEKSCQTCHIWMRTIAVMNQYCDA